MSAVPVTGPIREIGDLAGRQVLVLGLARSGLAAARMLADAGAEVTVYDRRSADELGDAIGSLANRPVKLALAAPPDAVRGLVGAADLVVTSPSISPDFPTTDAWLREALASARAQGSELVSEVELFLRLTRARVLAVTGTKGKTTTTALVGAIMSAAGLPHAVGGNIGSPLIERVADLGPHDWAVLELSELQLPTITRGAEVAIYTNIGADHLDRHASVAAYRAVKARLAELSVPAGRVVLNADDPGCRDLGARLPGQNIAWYGVDATDDGMDGMIDRDRLIVRGEELMPVADVPLPGRHLLGDALAAAVGCGLAGVPGAAIAAGIRGFGGVPHRLETVGQRDSIRWVNDSQATIPMATLAALDAFPAGRVVLIAGGKDKGLDYAELADRIAQRCRAAILLGETADELATLIAGRIPVRRAASMLEAVTTAAGVAEDGDVVLLSPAAASFDMFVDYAARGDAFRAAAEALIGEGAGR